MADRVAGSIGIMNAVRCATAVWESPDDPAAIRLYSIKNSYARPTALVEFKVVVAGPKPDQAGTHLAYLQPVPDYDDEPARERLTARILAYMVEMGRPVDVRELVSAVGLTYGIISMLLLENRDTFLNERQAWHPTPEAIAAVEDRQALTSGKAVQ